MKLCEPLTEKSAPRTRHCLKSVKLNLSPVQSAFDLGGRGSSSGRVDVSTSIRISLYSLQEPFKTVLCSKQAEPLQSQPQLFGTNKVVEKLHLSDENGKSSPWVNFYGDQMIENHVNTFALVKIT